MKIKKAELTYYTKDLMFYIENLDIDIEEGLLSIINITNDIDKADILIIDQIKGQIFIEHNIIYIREEYFKDLNKISGLKVKDYHLVFNQESLEDSILEIGKNIYNETEVEKYKVFYEENKNLLEHKVSELEYTLNEGTALITMDAEKKIININKKASDIIGYKEDEKDKYLFDLINPDEPEIIKIEILDKINEGKIYEGRISFLTYEKTSVFTLMTIIPLTNNNKEITEYKVLLNEITELIKFLTELESENEEISEQNDMKSKELFQQSKQAAMGELISMIAHQWRQPLSTIGLIVSDLQLKTAFKMYDPVYYDTAFKKLENHISYMSDTIDDFRNFFKPDKKKELFNVFSVFENAISIIGTSLEGSNIYMHVDNFTKEAKIETFKNEFLQVILNLIKNSKDIIIERKVKNPYIRISSEIEDNCIYIKIEDNGGGIDKDKISKVFDPYFSTKDEKNGTGLGLSMTKTIIEGHMDGKISVINKKNGAEFTIRLKLPQK